MTNPTQTIPARTDNNLIVASYNIQWLGGREHDLSKLAEVIQHFDVCGLIEVKAETAIPLLVKALREKSGTDWGYVHGIRTHRPGGDYHEIFGFVWRRDRVQLGDGVVSNIWDKTEKFRNDPFVATFRRGSFDFVMGLIHTRWTADAEGSREEELRAAAEQITWMRTFIAEQDFLLSGDFNFSGSAPAMEDLMRAAGLVRLDDNATSTFKADGTGFASSYDHILTGGDGKETQGRLTGPCTTLDVCYLVYGDNAPENMKKARSELSDHLPVFAVFST